METLDEQIKDFQYQTDKIDGKKLSQNIGNRIYGVTHNKA